MIVDAIPAQCCVPADGSAHAVIVDAHETDTAHVGPGESPAAPAAGEGPSVAVEPRSPVTPAPVSEPLEPLEPLSPIAPASAEKPLPPTPPAATEPALAPQAEPPMKEAPPAPVAEPAPIEEPPVPIEPPSDVPAPTPVPEEEAAPVESAPKPPAPKPPVENFFDEDGDDPAEKSAGQGRTPMKRKEPPREPVEDLFDEPEDEAPSGDEKPAPTERPADEAPGEEPSEKTEDDPFATLDAHPEPVRRWIDSSGLHETIGRLVEVHPDRVRILKRNGRYTTVPMQRLSKHDQAYATAVGERLAGRSPTRPAVTDTAHR